MAKLLSKAYLVVTNQDPATPPVPDVSPEIPRGLPTVPETWSVHWESGGWAGMRDAQGRRYSVLRLRDYSENAEQAVYVISQRIPAGRDGLEELLTLINAVYSVPVLDAFRAVNDSGPFALKVFPHFPDWRCSGEEKREDTDPITGDPTGSFTWVAFAGTDRRILNSETTLMPPVWPSANAAPMAFDTAGNVVARDSVDAVLRDVVFDGHAMTRTIAGYDDTRTILGATVLTDLDPPLAEQGDSLFGLFS